MGITRELTTQQVAEYHGVTTEAVRHWVRAGKLTPARAVGKAYLFAEADVHQFVPLKPGRPPGAADQQQRTRRYRRKSG